MAKKMTKKKKISIFDFIYYFWFLTKLKIRLV